MKPDRPDWIACVVSDVGEGHELHERTWCGRPRAGFVFTSVDHAALNGQAGGRLVVCDECLDAIVRALRNGHS